MLKRKTNYIYIILGIIMVILFFFTQGVTWYKIGGDTEAYYIHFEHRIEVAPLYPLFFHVLDLIFGSELYLYVASVIQLFFTVLCVMAFVRFIGQSLRLEPFSIVMVYLASLIPFYLLLPENPIPHDLMTESFTYPMMYVYMVLVLKGMYDDKEKYFFYSIIFTEIMALIRGQMMFLFGVSTIAYFIYLVNKAWKMKRKEIGRIIGKISLILMLSVFCMFGGNLLTEGYNRVFFDAPAQSFASHLAVQKALYLSDEEDKQLFDDKITKEIYERTWEQIKEEKSAYQYADNNLWIWKHAIGSFGANSWFIQDAIEEVLSEHGLWSQDELKQEELVMAYSKEINNVLIKDNWKKYIPLFFKLIPSAFVSTILFHKASIYTLIHIMTLALYIAMIVGSVLISKKRGKLIKESEFVWVVLINAILNVVSANIMHMGVQRYQAYTVGLFYVGMYLMVRQVILMWKESRYIFSKD